jgi:hypothetical protein
LFYFLSINRLPPASVCKSLISINVFATATALTSNLNAIFNRIGSTAILFHSAITTTTAVHERAADKINHFLYLDIFIFLLMPNLHLTSR